MSVADRSRVPEAQRREQLCRARASLRPALARSARLLFVFVLPVALLLQAVCNLLRHVGLVVLGEHAVGAEGARRIKGAFGDDPLPFAEQIRQQALIGDGDGAPAVGDLEADGKALSPLHASFLDQAADPDAGPGLD